MKKLFPLLLLFSPSLFVQNLVPNLSFEQFDTCPDNFGQIYYAGNWYSAGITPDYFNACDPTNGVSVPKNVVGFQYARTGVAYAGWGNGPTNCREYMQIQRISPLQANKNYCLEFYRRFK